MTTPWRRAGEAVVRRADGGQRELAREGGLGCGGGNWPLTRGEPAIFLLTRRSASVRAARQIMLMAGGTSGEGLGAG